MKYIIPIFLLLVLFLSGCNVTDVAGTLDEISNETIDRYVNRVVVCPEPYMRFSHGCCKDVNNNSICDANE